jgi:hypothetical protein
MFAAWFETVSNEKMVADPWPVLSGHVVLGDPPRAGGRRYGTVMNNQIFDIVEGTRSVFLGAVMGQGLDQIPDGRLAYGCRARSGWLGNRL